MNWLVALLLSQFLVSATAGLVGQVRGEVNVKMGDLVAAGASVDAGPNGLIDLQLNPGAHLRLRANSSLIFQSTALTDIEFSVTRGFVLADFDSDPPFPVKATSEDLRLEIRKAGVYGISPGSVRVFDGQLEITRGKVLKKGDMAVAQKGDFQMSKLPKDEVRHPYASDRLKLFVQPKEDDSQKIPSVNAMFVKFVQENFRDVHDVEIIQKPDGADYVLRVDASLKSEGFDTFIQAALVDSAGTVLFSNERHESEYDSGNAVRSSDLFLSGDRLARRLIEYVTNRTGWR